MPARRLTEDEVHKLLSRMPGWRVVNGKLRYVHTLTHLLQANFRGGRGGGQAPGGAGGPGRGAPPNNQQ